MENAQLEQVIDNDQKRLMEKSDKFIELGESRVSKAIKAIKLIGNLSNKSTYHYESEQIEEMFEVIEKEIREQKSKFRIVEVENKSTFSFKSKSLQPQSLAE